MRITFVFILVVHGLIHLIGLLSAFGLLSGPLKSSISRQQGYLWGLTSVLFITAGILLFWENDLWLFIGLLALINSQYLIFKTWRDSKFGSIINLVILIGLIYGFVHYI